MNIHIFLNFYWCTFCPCHRVLTGAELLLDSLFLFIPVTCFESATMDKKRRIAKVKMSSYQYDSSLFHHKNLKGDSLKVSFLMLANIFSIYHKIKRVFCLKSTNIRKWQVTHLLSIEYSFSDFNILFFQIRMWNIPWQPYYKHHI